MRLCLAFAAAKMAIVLLLTGCAEQGPKPGDCAPQREAQYELFGGKDRGLREQFAGAIWRASHSPPMESALEDCSNAEARCLRRASDGAVWAVPRSNVAVGHRLLIGGAELLYLGCYAEGEAPCHNRVLLSTFGNPAPAPLGTASSEAVPPTIDELRERILYVYRLELGIVAFQSLPIGQHVGGFVAADWEGFDFRRSDFAALTSARGILACAAASL
jgi:hypothetical protein